MFKYRKAVGDNLEQVLIAEKIEEEWQNIKITRASKKLSALLFFQFIYTKVGVEQVRHFST
jgi:hypothetical protein